MQTIESTVEIELWDALEMNAFGEALQEVDPMAPIMFGTGHTVNSCQACDNSLSACSAGENNCNPRITNH